MLGVDKGADAAALLSLRDQLERQRGLAGRLRPEDLDHTPARDPPDAERDVEAERSSRQRGDLVDEPVLAELHDGALAELLLDLAERQVDRPLAVHVDTHFTPLPARCHSALLGCADTLWRAPPPKLAPMTAHSPLASDESPAPAMPFSGVAGATTGEREPRDGLVHGAARAEAAVVEHELVGRPRPGRRA